MQTGERCRIGKGNKIKEMEEGVEKKEQNKDNEGMWGWRKMHNNLPF